MFFKKLVKRCDVNIYYYATSFFLHILYVTQKRRTILTSQQTDGSELRRSDYLNFQSISALSFAKIAYEMEKLNATKEEQESEE